MIVIDFRLVQLRALRLAAAGGDSPGPPGGPPEKKEKG